MVLPWLCFGPLDAHAAEDWAGSTYYFGDLHAHSGVSPDGGSSDLTGTCRDDGSCGATSEAFAIARSNGIDFVAFADHNYSSAEAFDAFQELVWENNDPAGRFLTIPSTEAAFRSNDGHQYGHKNAFVFSDDASVHLRLADFPSSGSVDDCDDIWKSADALAAYGPTLLFAHHPAAADPMPTDWSCHDQTYEPVVEVVSEHGNSLEPSGDYHPVRTFEPDSDVHAALELFDLKLGFVGSTDNHMTQPGAVCVLDTEKTLFPYGGALTMLALPQDAAFTRASIYDEITARRTFATTGPRVPVSVQWTLGGGRTAGVGEVLRVREGDAVQLTVSVPTTWAHVVRAVRAVGYEDQIEIPDAGDGVWSGTIDTLDLANWRYVAVEIDGELVYGVVDACVDGPDADDRREFVWSSPDWFERTDDVDMDGVAYPKDCDDDDAAVFPGAPEVWYDGVDGDCDGGSDYDADGDGGDATGFGGSDCNDAEADVFAGAPEVWYDDVDQDCDGGSDHDQDRDGYDRRASGGTDCNDLDASLSPGALEVWYDSIDQDCDGRSDFDADRDGFDATQFGGSDCDDHDADVRACPEDPKGGCGHANGAGPAGWFLALVMLVARRRSEVGRARSPG